MKSIWLLYSDLQAFFHTRKRVFLMIEGVLTLTIFSALLLLRMGWVSYQDQYLLSQELYDHNTLYWGEDVSISEKEQIIDELLALPSMPALTEVSSDTQAYWADDRLQQRWQQLGNPPVSETEQPYVILNEAEARQRQLQAGNRLKRGDRDILVYGVWEFESASPLSQLEQTELAEGRMFSFSYEEDLSSSQHARIENILASHTDVLAEPADLLYDRQQVMYRDFLKTIGSCLGVLLLGMINALLLIWFWNHQKREDRRILYLCGCRPSQVGGYMLGEIVLLSMLAWGLACLLFLLSTPLQNALFWQYTYPVPLPFACLCGIGAVACLLQLLLFLPVYVWQEERI